MQDSRKDAPKLWLIAGPNGAGKTTFAKVFLPEVQIFEFLNADLIAAGLSPLRPQASAYEASRLLLRRWDSLTEQRQDFAVETTLSGKSYVNRISSARSMGYRIYIAYLWLPDLKISLKRIRQRVKKGGHNVPEADARRRFPRSLVHFKDVYLPLCHHATVWDVSILPSQRIVEWNRELKSPNVYKAKKYEHLEAQVEACRKSLQ